MLILFNREHPTSQVIACPQSPSTKWRNSWHPLGPAPTCWHLAREKGVWGWGSLSDICTAQLDAWQSDTQLYSTHAPRTWNQLISFVLQISIVEHDNKLLIMPNVTSPCPSSYNFIWCWSDSVVWLASCRAETTARPSALSAGWLLPISSGCFSSQYQESLTTACWHLTSTPD